MNQSIVAFLPTTLLRERQTNKLKVVIVAFIDNVCAIEGRSEDYCFVEISQTNSLPAWNTGTLSFARYYPASGQFFFSFTNMRGPSKGGNRGVGSRVGH